MLQFIPVLHANVLNNEARRINFYT